MDTERLLLSYREREGRFVWNRTFATMAIRKDAHTRMDRGVTSSINVTQEMKMPANAGSSVAADHRKIGAKRDKLGDLNAAEWERGSSRSRREAGGLLTEG